MTPITFLCPASLFQPSSIDHHRQSDCDRCVVDPIAIVSLTGVRIHTCSRQSHSPTAPRRHSSYTIPSMFTDRVRMPVYPSALVHSYSMLSSSRRPTCLPLRRKCLHRLCSSQCVCACVLSLQLIIVCLAMSFIHVLLPAFVCIIVVQSSSLDREYLNASKFTLY